MTLNPAWDVFFGLVLLGKSFWYYSEKPKNHGVSLTRQIAFYIYPVVTGDQACRY